MLAQNERRRFYGKELLAYNQLFLSAMRHQSLLQRFDIGFVAIEPEAKRIAASHDDDLRDGQGEGRASHFRAKQRLRRGAVAGRRRHRGAGIGDVAGLAWQILLKKRRTFRHHLPIVGCMPQSMYPRTPDREVPDRRAPDEATIRMKLYLIACILSFGHSGFRIKAFDRAFGTVTGTRNLY